MDFASRLKELRESRNITQEQLAGLLKVSRPTVAGYETKQRQPDYDKLIMLSEIFHVSIDYLLTGHEISETISVENNPVVEKQLHRKVSSTYKKLGFKEKQDVLEYIEFLEQRKKVISFQTLFQQFHCIFIMLCP